MAVKVTKKVIYELSNNDRKLLKLVIVAGQLVLKEDKDLLKELAKH